MMRKQTRPEFRLRPTRVAALLVGVVLISGATTEDAGVLATRRKSIERMSQSELNQLKRNYENYLKLSPERREQLARLNDELVQDAKSGGHLQKLLDQYCAWLFKLSPFDRDKLLNTADPGERAQMVQKILQDQQKQRSARASRAPFAVLALHFDGGPVLTSNDLDAVLNAVEESFLKDDAKKRLARTTAPRERHIQILRLTMEELRRERDAKTGPRPRGAALVNAMLDAIPNPDVKSRIAGSRLPQQVRRQLGLEIARSVLAEWKPEVEESPVSGAQIDEMIGKWVAFVPDERKEAAQERLQTENGRKFITSVVAVQNNPKLKRLRQPVMWLLRSFPAPQIGRAARAAAQSSLSDPGAPNAAGRPNDDSEKDPASAEP